MANIRLSGTGNGVTAIPNLFLDVYLPQADGEYVKVYLLLWRYFCAQREISVSMLADLLEDTEKDILRAVQYWVKKGLLQVTYGQKKEIAEIVFLPVPNMAEIESSTGTAAKANARELAATAQEISGRKTVEPVRKKQDKHRTITPAVRKQLTADEEFGQLVYVTSKYLDEPLMASGSDVLGYLYGELHMRADLLEYLIESCVEAGHKSLRYIETVALDWHERGIVTVDQAREQEEIHRKQYYQVMKTFGIYNRGITEVDKKYMDAWFGQYGFALDVVLEACKRTIESTNQPSFKYADHILKVWYQNDVKSMADIQRLDAAYRQKRETEQTKSNHSVKAKEAAKSNRFHNFDQVGYDYDAIVKELGD